MTPAQAKILELIKSHPVPSQDKLDRRVKRIERMKAFYEDKQADAPEKQALMFKGFVSALVYAMAMIKMHRKLCIALNELAEEIENGIVEADK
jgi:hypothetical protein